MFQSQSAINSSIVNTESSAATGLLWNTRSQYWKIRGDRRLLYLLVPAADFGGETRSRSPGLGGRQPVGTCPVPRDVSSSNSDYS